MESCRARNAHAPFYAAVALFTFGVAIAILSTTVTNGAGIMFAILISLRFGVDKKRTFIIVPLIVVSLVHIYNANEDLQARLAPDLAVFTAEGVTEDVASGVGGGRVFTYLQLLDVYANKFNAVRMLFGSGRWYGAHNQYLALLLQLGVMSLAVFLAMIWRFHWRLWSFYSKYKRPALFMAMAVFTMLAVAPKAGTPIYYTTLLWYVMLLMGLENVTSYSVPKRASVGRGSMLPRHGGREIAHSSMLPVQ